MMIKGEGILHVYTALKISTIVDRDGQGREAGTSIQLFKFLLL